jgi:thiol-disulfide isomerase/thioredoxin
MRKVRSWRYWPWLRDGAVALALLFAIRAYQQRNTPSGAAPALDGVALNGQRLALADYRGAPVLLHFWATWCGVCKAEQGNIDAVARELPVLSVASSSGDARAVEAYVRAHAVAPAVIADPDGALARRFGVHSFPTSFVIDAKGEIRHVEVGYTTELGLRLRMWLARL